MVLLPVGDLSRDARAVLGTALWMGTWWIGEIIPIYVTALLPLLLFPLAGSPPLQATRQQYADSIIFLFLGGFMLARAIERVGLDRRFALSVLAIAGNNPRLLTGGFMLATASMSAWISNTATTMLMLPIAASVVGQIGQPAERDRFGTCLMLAIAYAASLGGLATLIGTPPNAILASLAGTLTGNDVSFGRWMLVGLPLSLASLAVVWWYLVFFGARVGGGSLFSSRDVLEQQYAALGRLSRDEVVVASVFTITAVAWFTRGLFWQALFPAIGDATIVLAAAVVLFVIPSCTGGSVLTWESAVRVPWGVLLLMGGGLALAEGFTVSGLDRWVAEYFAFLSGAPHVVIIATLVGVTIFAGEVMSNTATAAVLLPIMASLAQTLGVHPLSLMVPVALATSYGFMLPVGTPPNAIVFGSGYVTTRQMARVGLPLDILGIVLVTAATLLLVPRIWG